MLNIQNSAQSLSINLAILSKIDITPPPHQNTFLSTN